MTGQRREENNGVHNNCTLYKRYDNINGTVALKESKMVGEGQKRYAVEDVLTDSQVCHIIKKCIGDAVRWQLVGADMRPAAEGIAGFLGDHFRLALTVKVDDKLIKIPLFVKSLPLSNSPKADFIDQNNFFRREMVVFKMMEEMETGGPNPWGARAFLYNESVLVMRDLAPQGYSIRPQLDTLDVPHLRVALATIARFHAANANLETRKQLALGRPYALKEEFGDVIEDSNFKDTPWIHAGAKLTANLIKHFSGKYKNAAPDLEAKILEQYLAACDDVVESKESLNVVIHKDLWVNNIMFKYEDDVPINAVLVDYQCVRYAPPAFDVMLFWYVTTSRGFREQNEADILRHYFTIFMDSLDVDTKLRLKSLCYDYEEFLRWIERSRRFGLLVAIMLYPYVLLDPESAREMFDDPATFAKYTNEDRSEPVLAHARSCEVYKSRQVEVCEEFVERYLGL